MSPLLRKAQRNVRSRGLNPLVRSTKTLDRVENFRLFYSILSYIYIKNNIYYIIPRKETQP